MPKENSRGLELILIYAGHGKGKTSACVGQALRAAGNGLKVAFGQFIKRENVAGEQKILASLPFIQYKVSGLGFIKGDLSMHREKALNLLLWASSLRVDMLVLDEALNALRHGLITKKELEPYLEARASKNKHLVLSGRDIPDWLLGQADMLTEMKEVKHQLKAGIKALPGLEY